MEDYKGYFDGITTLAEVQRTFVKEASWITQSSRMSAADMSEYMVNLSVAYGAKKTELEIKEKWGHLSTPELTAYLATTNDQNFCEQIRSLLEKREQASTDKYKRIIDRAKLLDPNHITTAEARRSEWNDKACDIFLITGKGFNNGVMLVSGIATVDAEQVIATWNGMKP